MLSVASVTTRVPHPIAPGGSRGFPRTLARFKPQASAWGYVASAPRGGRLANLTHNGPFSSRVDRLVDAIILQQAPGMRLKTIQQIRHQAIRPVALGLGREVCNDAVAQHRQGQGTNVFS